MDHSSEGAPHGSLPAIAPRLRLDTRFQAKIMTETAWTYAPIELRRLKISSPWPASYTHVRRGMPINPDQCIGMNVRFIPMNASQKCHEPSASLNNRPVSFGK